MEDKTVTYAIFGVIAIVVICFFVYFVIATGVNVLHKEFIPEIKIPTKIEQSISTVSTEGTTATNVKDNLKINDLAYIKILVVGYSAGASPKWDGISIDIGFYNSNRINFNDCTCNPPHHHFKSKPHNGSKLT